MPLDSKRLQKLGLNLHAIIHVPLMFSQTVPFDTNSGRPWTFVLIVFPSADSASIRNENLLKTNTARQTEYIYVLVYIQQSFSSSPLVQSFIPLHVLFSAIHCLLNRQWYSCSPHLSEIFFKSHSMKIMSKWSRSIGMRAYRNQLLRLGHDNLFSHHKICRPRYSRMLKTW